MVVGLILTWIAYNHPIWHENKVYTGIEGVNFDLLPLSLAVQAVYILFVAKLASDWLVRFEIGRNWRLACRRTLPLALQLGGVWIVAIAARALLLEAFPSAEQMNTHVARFLWHLLGNSVVKPGLFLVAHASYFGPAAVLLLVYSRRVAQAAAAIGPGALLSLFALLALALDTESRRFIYGYPMLVVLLTLALNRLELTASFIAAVGTIGFAASKIWFTLNPGGPGGDPGVDPMRQPLQRMFMHYGPYMSLESYTTQLLWLLVLGAPLAFLALRQIPDVVGGRASGGKA